MRSGAFVLTYLACGFCSDQPVAVTDQGNSDETPMDLREFSLVDPCITYCVVSNAGDCSKVHSVGESCSNLAYGLGNQVRVSFSKHPDVRHVKTQDAFTAVSTDSCMKACEATVGCKGSFCKPNGHCQSLLWEDFAAGSFCFHSDSSSCRLNAPLHCSSNEDLPTNAPTVSSQMQDTDAVVHTDESVFIESSNPIGTGAASPSGSTQSPSSTWSRPEETRTSQRSSATERKTPAGAALQSSSAGSARGMILLPIYVALVIVYLGL